MQGIKKEELYLIHIENQSCIFQSKEIPLDPDAMPPTPKVSAALHDFAQKYVIAWSRLTDRNATVPIERTGSGIQLAADLASLRTMKKESN